MKNSTRIKKLAQSRIGKAARARNLLKVERAGEGGGLGNEKKADTNKSARGLNEKRVIKKRLATPPRPHRAGERDSMQYSIKRDCWRVARNLRAT